MEFPDALEAVWLERDDATWLHRGYREAVARIEDRTDDQSNPYFYGPASGHDAFSAGVNDQFGCTLSPEAARREAFELLVLADLAPLTPEPKS